MSDTTLLELIEGLTLVQATQRFQRVVVCRALQANEWHCGRTAQQLGVHRNTPRRVMDELHIRRVRAGRKAGAA